jgi:Predicted helicase
MYRPFIKTFLYFDEGLIHRRGQHPEVFPEPESKNLAICVTDAGSAKPFMTLAMDKLPDLHLVGTGASTQCLPLYRYIPRPDSSSSERDSGQSAAGDLSGLQRVDNITDWALGQFQKHYGVGATRQGQTRAKSGKAVPQEKTKDGMGGSSLHYEKAEPYPLERGEREGNAAAPEGLKMQPTCH